MRLSIPLLSFLACLHPVAHAHADTPAELVAALAGADPSAALEALAKLDPAETFPLLLDCLREGEAEHAWQAGRVVHRLLDEQPKHKLWRRSAGELVELASREGCALANRCSAALSIRDSAALCQSEFDLLAQRLAREEPSALRLATALACGGLDGKLVAELKKNMKQEGMMRMLWSTTALACMGEEASAAKKTLVTLIEDEDSLTAFLVCRANMLALELVAGPKAVEAPSKERLSHSRNRTWSGGANNFNFGGVMPVDVKAFFSFFAAQSHQAPRDVDKMSLPQSFLASMNGRVHTVADGVQCFALHLTRVALELRDQLAQGHFSTWAQWQDATAPLLALVDFMNQMDSHVPR